MSDFNEILKGLDTVVEVPDAQINGIIEQHDTETAPSILRVHLSIIKAIQFDSNNLYNKIDQTILDMKYEGTGGIQANS